MTLGIFESETPKGKNNTKGIKEVEESQSKGVNKLIIHIDPSIITTRQICITLSIKKPIDYESASNRGFIKYLTAKEKKNFNSQNCICFRYSNSIITFNFAYKQMCFIRNGRK